MDEVAATPQGGAEVSARPEGSTPVDKQSTTERLKSYFSLQDAPDPKPTPGEVAEPAEANEPKAVKPSAVQEVDEVEETEEPEGDALTAAQLSNLRELADATGLEVEKLLDLDVPTKIDGKEGSARLRDLVKSYQLEGHLNQKLMTFAEDKKNFEAEASRKVGEYQQRVGQLNSAVQLAQRILDGEYAGVNWQELQQTDPASFQAQYGGYKIRMDGISALAQQVSQESQRSQGEAEAQAKSYFAEQQKLLDSKLPEWADKSTREKDVASISAAMKDTYGLTPDEISSITDHRHVLIMRDAAKWQALQKAKPAIVNKVKTAPKLLRPGSTQSKATQDGQALQSDRARLRQSGNVKDAASVLKRLIF